MPRLVHEDLTGIIRHTAFEVHRYFGYGFLEKVYKNALVNRLGKQGLQVDPTRQLTVRDEDGSVVGEYEPDLVVEECIIVELKAARSLNNEHIAQLLNYLKATGTRVGLLVNFGAARLQVKRYVFGSSDSVSSVSSVASRSRAGSACGPQGRATPNAIAGDPREGVPRKASPK